MQYLIVKRIDGIMVGVAQERKDIKANIMHIAVKTKMAQKIATIYGVKNETNCKR
jgi:hypothetical protein